ncbi:sensor histidine kinase [uncultured Friedmanniella sp.]|uniref:sensor histidine kinase n=1 Tax=uncultured Friedmanniella sp. TaxID=335381 RepID=UPI0035CB09F3
MTAVAGIRGLGLPRTRSRGSASSSEPLLADRGYVQLVRWVFTARLVCLALAAPAVFSSSATTVAAALSLGLLTVSSLVLGRSDALIRILIRHPLLAFLDTATSVALLVSVPVGQPATLTVVCSALLGGLLFPRAVLVLLLVPLVVASLGAPAAFFGAAPTSWTGWLALVAGLPALVIGVCAVGSGVRRSTQAMIQARHEVAEAVAAVGAADERARLARDMHDSVGKSIHGISLGAKALRRLVDSDPVLARDLAGSLAGAADQAAREARALLLTLRAGQHDRPTVDVVTEVLAGWQRETGIPALLSEVAVVDADPEVTRQLAAALGEVLHNVAKHAGASQVLVGLVGSEHEIQLVVSDNGVGFDPAGAPDRERDGHFGLRGLRERASAVRGSVHIDSEVGKGTTVTWTARRQGEGG